MTGLCYVCGTPVSETAITLIKLQQGEPIFQFQCQSAGCAAINVVDQRGDAWVGGRVFVEG